MFLKISLAVAVAVAAFLIYVAAKDPNYQVSREILIQAPAEKIFPYVNNSKKMNDWNPWMELDPKAKVSFSGPDEGVGTKTSWADGEKLGTGSATVVEAETNKRVRTQLEYRKPFEMTQFAEISIHPEAGGSRVTWSVGGNNSFIGRLMCTLSRMSMDDMVGKTFEKGLQKLKNRVEQSI
jgi:uncharacterized protein YndB with AHSA1/START domain